MTYRVAMLSVHTCPLATLGGKESGGMNVYVRDLSRELGRRGLSVDVFTRVQDPKPPLVGELGENARVIHLQAGPKRPYDKNLVYHHLPQFTENLKRFAEREGIGYHLIHSHYWLSGIVARDLQREWRVPSVHMFHTLGLLKNRVAENPKEKETEQRIEAERQIVRFADRLVAANPLEKAQLIWSYGASPSRLEVIPCGVDLGLFRPLGRHDAKAHLQMPDGHKVVLFVGRIEPLKGIDVLMRAMALVLKDIDMPREDVCLCIIGGDPKADNVDREMSRLQQMRERLGIADVVMFLGKRDQDALPYYYSAAEVCVVPSHYESFGMVALEAMACGTPVIASRVGGLTFTVKDGRTGFLVPNDDPGALAGKLKLLLTDDDLRSRMGQEGTRLARRYGWSIVATQVVALYRELVTASRPQICCRDRTGSSGAGVQCCE
jgi:D-inositol-3-phosphate glycosyltransferase